MDYTGQVRRGLASDTQNTILPVHVIDRSDGLDAYANYYFLIVDHDPCAGIQIASLGRALTCTTINLSAFP